MLQGELNLCWIEQVLVWGNNVQCLERDLIVNWHRLLLLLLLLLFVVVLYCWI